MSSQPLIAPLLTYLNLPLLPISGIILFCSAIPSPFCCKFLSPPGSLNEIYLPCLNHCICLDLDHWSAANKRYRILISPPIPSSQISTSLYPSSVLRIIRYLSVLIPSNFSIPFAQFNYCVYNSPLSISCSPTSLAISMDRSEDFLHCSDLQAELEEVRAQQRILENQQKNLETRLED